MPVIQFKGKTAIESYHHTIPHHTLEFDPKLSVLPKGEKPSLDGNLIIEGDNLLALKALLPTHAGRIKCIYIDPPYNTGNEGWVYNDNLTQPQFKEWIGKTVGKEGEDFTRHDKWCCMMYPRLQLLKELLRDDGAIFVSIDDTEVHHLRMLMDEVFGPDNLMREIVWKNKYGPGAMTKGFGSVHEYILCYSRSRLKSIESRLTAEEIARYTGRDGQFQKRGGFITQPLMTRSKDERPNLIYSVTYKGEEIWPDTQWIWESDRLLKAIKDDEVVFRKSEDKWSVRFKQYLRDKNGDIRKGKPISILDGPFNQEGTWEIERIFGNKEAFQNPKPSALIRRLLSYELNGDEGKNSLCLDSTAGSGTTAHAVLELNKEDGGSRRFILVQQPYDTKENEKKKFNISERVTVQRVRKVIEGYTYVTARGKKEKLEGLGGTFSYGRLGPVLFGEYRDLGSNLPSYEEIAKYVFYTETSREFDKKALNSKTGKIGEYRKTGYYLLYTSNNKEDRALDLEWLKSIEKSEKNRNVVVYCEKIWIHRDDLAKYEKDTGRKVRPMLVPFNLK